MVSRLKLEYDINEDTVGYISEKVEMPLPGSPVKFFVPRIMQNIDQGEGPTEVPSKYQYSSSFVSASGCKPSVNKGIKEKNYIEGAFDNNTSITPLAVTTYDMFGLIVDQYIPAEEKMRVDFRNGKLTKMRVNTNDTTAETNGVMDQKLKWASYNGPGSVKTGGGAVGSASKGKVKVSGGSKTSSSKKKSASKSATKSHASTSKSSKVSSALSKNASKVAKN